MVDTDPKEDGWGGLDRVMKEKVLVVWHDDEENVDRHLGCLYEAGHEDADCEEKSLEINKYERGHHQAENEYANCKGDLSLEIYTSTGVDRAVVVVFHLPVTTESRAKHPKDMYIVIPTSGLSMRRDVVDAVPENIGEHLPPTSSYNCIRLQLSGSKPPYAIMPDPQRRRRQLGKLLKGIEGQLMMNLESMSKTRSWDAFLVGNITIQNQIDATCRLLGGHACEPWIDLSSIYNNGICGCVNNWEDYPYEKNDRRILPPYDETAPRNPQSTHAVPSKSQESGSELGWRTSMGPNLPVVLYEGDAAAGAASTKRKKEVKVEPSNDDATVARKRTCMTATSKSNLNTAEKIAAWHRKLDLARTASVHEPSPTQADTDSSTPLHEDRVPLVEGPIVLAKEDGVPAERHPSYDVRTDPTPPYTSPPAAATDLPGPQPDCHSRPGELYSVMAHFLLYCLKFDPSTPTRYKKQLQQMAHGVYQQDETVFLSVKRTCVSDLHARRACCELPMQRDPTPLEQQIEELYVWLDAEVSKEAYVYTGRHFVRLQEAKTMGNRLRFEILKADLYAAAFWVADALNRGCTIPPPVLCTDCIARLTSSYPSFR